MPSQVKIVDLQGGGGGKAPGPPKTKPPAESPTAKRTADRDLRARLETIFDRIGDAAEARGDEELADVVREDKEVMAGGLVSLTTPFKALRTPLLFALGIVEPVMAFSRIVRLMLGRTLDHRAEKRDPGSPAD